MREHVHRRRLCASAALQRFPLRCWWCYWPLGGAIAQRKPMLGKRVPGGLPLLLAERTSLESLPQLPPRITLAWPLSGPVLLPAGRVA
jgi:hypothetical protein